MDSIPLLVLLKYGPDLLGYNMRNNYFVSGDWNIICDVCGWKIKATDTKHRWDGRITCRKCWEPRHDADFIKARKVDGNGGSGSVPWTQPDPPEVSVSPYDTYITSGSNGAEGFGNAVASGFQGNVSVVADGDHPAGDGLTRLQTTFDGGSAADISGYAVPETVTGGTLGDGYYDVIIPINTASVLGVSYASNGIARQASGGLLTVEVFMSLEAYPTARNSSTQTHVYLNNLTSNMQGGNNPIQIQTTGGYTATNFIQAGSSYANWNASGDKTPGLLSSIRHIAWVWYADNTYAVYYNGVRQATPAADSTYLLGSPTPQILLGSPSLPAYWTDLTMRYYGVRVRRDAMYSGANFSPPASPEVWGPP